MKIEINERSVNVTGVKLKVVYNKLLLSMLFENLEFIEYFLCMNNYS